MTDPHHSQQPPYQHHSLAPPPAQPQSDATPSLVESMPQAQPSQAHSRKTRLIAAIATVAALLFVGGWYVVYDQFIREDSGVAACKAMRDGKKMDGSPKNSGDDKLTEDEYREAREVFEDSRYDDIREHGTALVDIAWQVQQLGDGQEMGALAFIGPMGTHMSGLQTACANQGVIVNLNKK